jgi:hypothetical protein
VTYGSPVPTITPSFSGFVNGETSTVLTAQPTCSTVYTTTSAVGTTPATSCTGAAAANYDISYVPGAITITKMLVTAQATGGTWVYDGLEHPGTCTISGGLTGTVTYTPGGSVKPVNVGTYALSCDYAGDANHNAAHASATIIITPKAAIVTAGNGTKVYGSGADPALSAITTSGFAGGDLSTITLAQSRVAGENVGSYVTTATATGGKVTNYSVTYVPGAFTITKRPLTVVANNKSKNQGAVNPALDGTLTGVVAGDNITATYSTTAVTSSPVGVYPITPALVDPSSKLGNYTVTITNGTLTVIAVTPPPPPPPPVCTPGTFDFSGTTSGSGTAGNVRSFTAAGVSVKATAFSRTKSNGAWSTAYLGSFDGFGCDRRQRGQWQHALAGQRGRSLKHPVEFSQPTDPPRLSYYTRLAAATCRLGMGRRPILHEPPDAERCAPREPHDRSECRRLVGALG